MGDVAQSRRLEIRSCLRCALMALESRLLNFLVVLFGFLFLAPESSLLESLSYG